MTVSRSEVERRLVHASGSVAPLTYLVGVLTWPQLTAGLLGGSVVVLALEAGRLSGAVDWVVYDRLTREYEQEGLAGYALYVFSMTLVAVLAADPVALFPRAAALAGMLMLTVADPVSGLLGSDELRDVKETSVLLATFGTATLLALAVGVGAVPAVFGGLAATVADGVKPSIRGYIIDDNLTIPPAAATAATVGTVLVARWGDLVTGLAL